MNIRSGIVILYLSLAGVAFTPACKLKPGHENTQASLNKPDSQPDSATMNDRKPRIVKDEKGNVTERYDVTFTPNGEIKYRNEYRYTYDARNNRTSEQIWRRKPDGSLVTRTHNNFEYTDGLLKTNTSISYDAAGQEVSWMQNRFEYDSQRRETSVTLVNKQGAPLSKTERLYNEKGALWKEIMIEYDNGREKKRSGLEYSDRGAVVKQF